MQRFRAWIANYPLLYITLFTVIYFVWFMALEKFREPVLIVHSQLDDMIPFCQYFVIPYLLWFLYIFGTFLFFLFTSKEDVANVSRYMFTGMIACLVIYTILPTGLNLRPAVTGDDICSMLTTLVYSNDTSTNVCPSIHVFNSLAVTIVINRSRVIRHKRIVKIATWTLAILICMSTVMLKQHSVIDVFWGSAMALILLPLASTPARVPAGESLAARRTA